MGVGDYSQEERPHDFQLARDEGPILDHQRERHYVGRRVAYAKIIHVCLRRREAGRSGGGDQTGREVGGRELGDLVAGRLLQVGPTTARERECGLFTLSSWCEYKYEVNEDFERRMRERHGSGPIDPGWRALWLRGR